LSTSSDTVWTASATAKWRRATAALALLALWPLLAWVAARALIVEANIPHADALVVLGGSAVYIERAQRAAELFHQKRAAMIILTNDDQRGGWSSAEQRNPFFVERAADELRRAGVPAEKIEVLPGAVAGTYDEAAKLSEYAARRGLRSLLVVTSGYHSRRALWALRRATAGKGIEVGLDAVAPGQQTPPPATWWLDRRGWRMVAGEYAKLIYYRLRY
jgi:uncharacterized SAM-binding protein YcdF (DUF218 family)